MSLLTPSVDALAAPRDRAQQLSDVAIALGVGIAAFLLTIGWKPLDVTNMLWLTAKSDGFTHYLGWEFFRRSAWTWPLGLSPDYGLQFSSSIIFSDSIPLIAIPLKLLSPLPPETFQYTGWWLLSCFVLQAWFACRLAGLISRDIALRFGLAVLLAFAPPMLWRMSVHYSLAGHWTILAALLLYFAPGSPRRWLIWAALLACTVLVHTYLMAMCLPLWLASMVRRRQAEGPLTPPWYVEVAAVFAAIAAALWVAGFFPLRPDFLSFGYGDFQLNLLSLINPNGSMPAEADSLAPEAGAWVWSTVMPPLRQAAMQYEGFNYLGLGGLLAVGLALPFVWTDRKSYRPSVPWPLLVAAVLLTLFAISPHIGFADYEAVVPVPDFVYALASSMRSSGRFFWPVFYMLPLGAAWLFYRHFGARATGLLFIAFAAVQVWDTSPGWSAARPFFELDGSSRTDWLSDPRLAAVASHYKAVRRLPAANAGDNWREISYFALRHHLQTDAVYLARPRDEDYARYAQSIDGVIARGGLETDSIYFLDADFARKVAASMSAADALFQVGALTVFAPRWHDFGVDANPPAYSDP